MELPKDQTINYVDISVDEFKELVAVHGKDAVITAIVQEVRDRFPDRSLVITKTDCMEMVEKLSKYKPKFVTRPYRIGNLDYTVRDMMFTDSRYRNATPRFTLLINYLDYYENYNSCVYHWFDLIRMTTRRCDQEKTPLETWRTETSKFVEYCSEHYPRINALHLRESVFELVKEATEFKPNVLAAMIEYFRSTRVLDFSAGRGARLIAAIAKKVDRYVGVDPDERLFPIYRNIISQLVSPVHQNRFTMICSPFQTVQLDSRETFDLVFTSPPYFNLEHYSDQAGQSDVEFSTCDAWYNGFLMPSAIRAWKMLSRLGYMIINLNDPGRSIENRARYTERFVQEFTTWVASNGGIFLGVISYAEIYGDKDPVTGIRAKTVDIYKGALRAPQPMWIWQKIKIIGT